MNNFNFSRILINAAKDLKKNPIVAVPSLILLALMIGLSKLSIFINYKLNTSVSLTAWLVIYSAVGLAMISLFFVFLIGMSKDAVRKKVSLKNITEYGKKYWIRNFVIIIIILLLYNASYFISYYSAFLIGKSLNLSVKSAQFLFIAVYFAFLIGILIFMTYANFCAVIYNLSVKDSIKLSRKLTKHYYIETLVVIIIFYSVYELISRLSINKILLEILSASIIVPYLSLILSRIVLENDLRPR